ncbi:hypothetical protein CCAX7_58770 [Capsulimonas corticalis]|uniref:Uncharacterized protein n=1 Tax=Capsulimonas corticalis TaxID=2219043 RepID=A0A402CZZ8_9BACT|nr:hypothetical protein CCAX7_58770 [Capsulimonas corticalis]
MNASALVEQKLEKLIASPAHDRHHQWGDIAFERVNIGASPQARQHAINTLKFGLFNNIH